MKGKFQLIDLGRSNFNGTVEVKNEDQFYKEVKKHLASREIEWEYDEAKGEGSIFVGGFRKVGTFKKVKEDEKTA